MGAITKEEKEFRKELFKKGLKNVLNVVKFYQ